MLSIEFLDAGNAKEGRGRKHVFFRVLFCFSDGLPRKHAPVAPFLPFYIGRLFFTGMI